MAETRIYLDTEYCYKGMTKESGRPTGADERQIVQIAAIKYLVGQAAELDYYDQLVFPKYTKSVPDFFTELTGIRQSDIDQHAVEFPNAIEEFVKFCGDYPIWTFDKDQEVMEQNLAYFRLPNPFKSDFIRVKSLLPNLGVDPTAYSSGTLYQAAGLDIEGHVHNALHDVRSMAAALDVLMLND